LDEIGSGFRSLPLTSVIAAVARMSACGRGGTPGRSRPHDAVFVGAIMEAVAENRCMMPLLVPVRERGEVSITTIQ
jgi:hypothetical protein